MKSAQIIEEQEFALEAQKFGRFARSGVGKHVFWRVERGTTRGHVSRTLRRDYRIRYYLSSEKLKAVD